MQKTVYLRLLLALAAWAGAYWIGNDMAQKAATRTLWQYEALWLMLLSWGGTVALFFNFFTTHPQRAQLVAASSLSGILLWAGFMPNVAFVSMFVGFVPLLWIEHILATDRSNMRSSAWTMFKFSFNAFLIWNILSTYWVINTAFIAGIFANIANAALMSLPMVFFHVVKKAHNPQVGNVAFLSGWLAWEWWHLYWQVSWPWLTLGNSFAHLPQLIQWYEYTGVFGGSLWILAVNLILANRLNHWYNEAKQSNDYTFNIKTFINITGKAALFFALPIIVSLVQWTTYKSPDAPQREVLALQPNHEPHYVKFSIPDNAKIPAFLRLIEQHSTPNTAFIVFPETSFDNLQLDSLRANIEVQAFAQTLAQHPNANIIMGISASKIYDRNDKIPANVGKICNEQECFYFKSYNSAIQVNAQTIQSDIPIYHKSKLVPGAENMPYIGDIALFQKMILDLGGTTGNALATQPDRDVFRSELGNVAPVICYESVYGGFVTDYIKKGANVLFVMTNDGWWGDTDGYVQHKYMSALRAIETRRWVVRAANTGTSCFINERGEILSQTDYDVETALLGNVAMLSDTTFYVRYGDLIARIALLVALLCAVSTLKKWITPKQ